MKSAKIPFLENRFFSWTKSAHTWQLGLLNEETNLTKEKKTTRYDMYSVDSRRICVTLMQQRPASLRIF